MPNPNDLLGPLGALALAVGGLGAIFSLYRDSQKKLDKAHEDLVTDLRGQVVAAAGRELARTAERDAALKMLSDANQLTQQTITATDKIIAAVRVSQEIDRRIRPR